jgi:hypothetical protein
VLIAARSETAEPDINKTQRLLFAINILYVTIREGHREILLQKYGLLNVHTIVEKANICGEQFSHDKRKHSKCRELHAFM